MNTNDIQLFALPLGGQLTSEEWNAFTIMLPFHVQKISGSTSNGRTAKEPC